MRIKSALEIALERTESVEGDPEKIRISELVKKGKRLMGSFILNHDATIETLKKEFDQVPENDKEIIRTNMVETLLANVVLPQDELYVQHLGKLKQGLEYLAGDINRGEDVTALFGQVDQLFQQYLQSRDQLLEMAKQQYEPQLKQKEEQLSRQTGRQVTLQPEQDPDFLKFLEANYKRLEEGYQEAIVNIRGQIGQLIAG